MAMAAAGVTAGVVGFWPRATLPEPWQNPLANAKFTRLTDFPGTETHGQISPDGRFVAFYSDRDGQLNLWLSQVDTGSFLKLTQNTRVHSSLRNGMRTLGFSRDGSEIWFNSAATDDRAAAGRHPSGVPEGRLRAGMVHGRQEDGLLQQHPW